MEEILKEKIETFLKTGKPGCFSITIKPNGDVLCEAKESTLIKKNNHKSK